MLVTREQIKQVMPNARDVDINRYYQPINATLETFEINTPERIRMFLAQIAVESNQLSATRENMNYSVKRLMEVFPKYFKNEADAKKVHAAGQAAIANRVYGDRMGNRGEDSNDGWNYRGGGPIQLTGRDNYVATAIGLGIELGGYPEIIEDPANGMNAAGYFWYRNGLNAIADKEDVLAATKRINGGTNGLAERKAAYARAQKAI